MLPQNDKNRGNSKVIVNTNLKATLVNDHLTEANKGNSTGSLELETQNAFVKKFQKIMKGSGYSLNLKKGNYQDIVLIIPGYDMI